MIEQGGKTGDNYFRNQHGVLSVGRHVCMFVVDDVLSKLKGFSFNKGKVIEVVIRVGSSLHFHRERDLYFLYSSKNSDHVHKHFDLVEVITEINVCSCCWILLKVTCEGEMSYQYQSVYLLY